MTSTFDSSERMALALERLQLRYSKEYDESGRAYWHIPFNGAQATVVTTYVGPIAAGVLMTLGRVEPVHYEALLSINAELTLAKVVLRSDLGVAVIAEVSAQHVDDHSMRLAISSVLEGTKRVRELIGTGGDAALPSGA
jgi:hypothetical protein